MTIATARLLLDRSKLADVPRLFEFLGDGEAMRHTHAARSLKDCRRRVAVHERRRRRDGCAPWVIRTKEDRRIVGWGGLFDDPFDPGWGIELGYWFDPASWGRGYASELAEAAVAFSDDQLRLPELRAFARPENAASRRVLEKAGFRQERYVPELERWLFARPRHGGSASAL